MRSQAAALRTIVLPFGQTVGRRIVLDGVAGQITIYGDDGQLVSRVDGGGYHLFDANGAEFQTINSDGYALYNADTGAYIGIVTVENRASLALKPPDIPGSITTPGSITSESDPDGKAAWLAINPPRVDDDGLPDIISSINDHESHIIVASKNGYTGDPSYVEVITASFQINGRDQGMGLHATWAEEGTNTPPFGGVAVEVGRLQPDISWWQWQPGRAYRITAGQLCQCTVAGQPIYFELVRNSVAGARLGMLGRVHCTLANWAQGWEMSLIFRNSTPDPILTPVVLTALTTTTSGNQGRIMVAPGTPRFLRAYDIGRAVDYPEVPQI